MAIKDWVKEKNSDLSDRYGSWKQEREENNLRRKELKEKEKEAEISEKEREELEALSPYKTAAKKAFNKTKEMAATSSGLLAGLFKGNRNREAPSFHSTESSIKWRINLFILFSLLFHFLILVQITNLWTKLFINFVLAIIVYFAFIPDEEKTESIKELFVVVSLYLTWDFFGAHFYQIGNGILYGYVFNPFFTPWWFYYAVLVRSKARTRISILLILAIILFWLGVLFSSVYISQMGIEEKGLMLTQAHSDNLKLVVEKSTEFWKNIASTIAKSIFNIKLFWQQRIEMATGGDYYAGRIEQSKGEPLGVTIEEVKAAGYEFEPDEQINVFGIIKARTLDDGIIIRPGCYLGYKTEYNQKFVEGDIGPEKEYTIFDMGEQDVDCRFPPAIEEPEIIKQSNQVVLTASFNFETMAYLKTYFMYQDRLRSLTRMGIDPLDEFGIKDKNPTAVFTNGPVMLGIGTKKPPLGVGVSGMGSLSVGDLSSTAENLVRIGVTVDNNYGWKGKIKRINQVIIEVPNSMEILFDTCSHPFTVYADKNNLNNCVNDYVSHSSKPFIECAEKLSSDFDRYEPQSVELAKKNTEVVSCVTETCAKEFDGFVGYSLQTSAVGKGLENIKTYKTFSCKFSVSDPEKLLGTAPITPIYFRARTRYDYEIEKTTSVKVKKILDSYGSSFVQHNNIGQIDSEDAFQSIAQKSWSSIIKFSQSPEEQCTIFALIAATSGGDPYFNANNRKGLLGLSPDIANAIAKKFGEQNSNIFDADTNIQYGIQLWNDIKSKDTEYLEIQTLTQNIPSVDNQDAVVVFTDTLKNDKLTYDAVIPLSDTTDTVNSVQSSCIGEKPYLCETNPFYKTYHSFLLNIGSYKEYCKKPEIQSGFNTVKELEEINTNNFWISKSIKVTQTTDEIEQGIEKNGYGVKITKSIKPNSEHNLVTLKVTKSNKYNSDNNNNNNNNNKEFLTKTFNIYKSQLLDSTWYHDSSYPFIRVALKSKNSDNTEFVFEMQYFDMTRVLVDLSYDSLLKSKQMIWQDNEGVVVYGDYNAPSKTLELYDGNSKKFCALNVKTSSSCSNIPQVKIYELASGTNYFKGYVEFNPK
ncbi:hypothetical protein HY636_00920 [Candidatus Woesearchaeota archaeon]|nr:hypothetical protein [Candidatus Woesearchaeota archaeon]